MSVTLKVNHMLWLIAVSFTSFSAGLLLGFAFRSAEPEDDPLRPPTEGEMMELERLEKLRYSDDKSTDALG